MTEIHRVLKQAAWRLFLIDLMRTAAVTSSVALFAIIAFRITDFFWPWVDSVGGWATLLGVAGGGALVGSLIWAIVRRARTLDVAREVDERANLRESISTAICVERSDDPWSRAVVETARERAMGVDVRQTVPYVSPRLAPMPMAFLLVLAVVWFSLGDHYVWAEAAQHQANQAELNKVATDLKEQEKSIEDLLKRANVDLEDLGDEFELDGELPENMTPEQLQRDMLKKMTSMAEKLQEQLDSGEKNKALEALKKQMQQLRKPESGPMDQMASAMQRGDFAKAKQELDKLAEQLSDQKLNPEQKEQLARQMENMAKQLAELSDLQKQLEDALKKSGLSEEQARKLAQNPESLQEAIEKMDGMSEQQKQQLKEAAKSMSSACKSTSGMSSALSQMAKGMSAQGMTQEGMEGMGQMGEQLSAAEMLDAEMQNMKAALGECKNMMAGLGNCSGDGECFGEPNIGPWRAGNSNKPGSGSGGPGKGTGIGPEEQQTAFKNQREKDASKRDGGPIIGQTLVDGPAIRGDSVAEFMRAVEIAGTNAQEEILNSEIRPEWEEAIKSYFGRLEQRGQEASSGNGEN